MGLRLAGSRPGIRRRTSRRDTRRGALVLPGRVGKARAIGIALLRTRRADTEEKQRLLHIVVATIPAAIAGLLLEEYAESTFRSPTLIASTLIVMGIVLWAADRYAPRDRPLGNMRVRDALLIGLAQIFALDTGCLTFRRDDDGSSWAAIRPSERRCLQLPHEYADHRSSGRAEGADVAARRRSYDPRLSASSQRLVSGWLAIAVLLRYVSRHSYGSVRRIPRPSRRGRPRARRGAWLTRRRTTAATSRRLRACSTVPRLVVLDSTASTMDDAHGLASDGAPAGTVVIADRQTSGRGRAGDAGRRRVVRASG